MDLYKKKTVDKYSFLWVDA